MSVQNEARVMLEYAATQLRNQLLAQPTREGVKALSMLAHYLGKLSLLDGFEGFAVDAETLDRERVLEFGARVKPFVKRKPTTKQRIFL